MRPPPPRQQRTPPPRDRVAHPATATRPTARDAVQAWLVWRDTLHGATGGDGTRDHMREMLRAWWPTADLPPVDRLNDEQARRVLDHIARMEVNGRPFDADVAPTALA